MLAVYRELFELLEKKNVQYCIYKGLDHLNEDLNAIRADGDIDIFVAASDYEKFLQVMATLKFHRKERLFAKSYLAFDKSSQQMALLDVATQANISGHKFFPVIVPLDFQKLRIMKDKKHSIYVLEECDYIPLNFLRMINSRKATPKNFEILKKNMAEKTPDSFFRHLTEEILDEKWSDIVAFVQATPSWDGINERYAPRLSKHSSFPKRLAVFLSKVSSRISHALGLPRYRIRKKGHLLAFVGIDGAGKTSNIASLLAIRYFQLTGIKMIYFGNNQYWIPGLNQALQIKSKHIVIKGLLALLASLDRQLRVIAALFYRSKGYIVVADRYFYDDLIGLELYRSKTPKRFSAKFSYLIRRCLKGRIWVIPDITFFLNVSAEIAFERKQDYSFEKVKEINKAYQNYMVGKEDVYVLDADKPQAEVFAEILGVIQRLDA